MIIKKIPSPVILPIIILGLLFVFEGIIPFQHDKNINKLTSRLILIGFYLIVLLVNKLYSLRLTKEGFKELPPRVINKIRLMVGFGPILLFIDRFWIRGLGLSNGLASLRYALENQSDGGISSIFSVLGYLGCAFSFLLLTNSIFSNKKSNKSYLDWFLIVFSILGVSVLTGGRSTLFIFFGILYSCIYYKLKLSRRWIKLSFKRILTFSSVILISLFYVVYVFKDRATLTGIDAGDYYKNIIWHLKGIEKENTDMNNRSDLYIYSQLTLAYFIHPLWILDETVQLNTSFRKGTSTFITWKNILSKIGFNNSNFDWYFGGYYIPLIGTFIYDYGLIQGTLVCLLLFTFLILGTKLFYNHYPSIDRLLLVNLTSYIVIFSAILPSTDVLLLPMIIISHFFLLPILKFLGKLKI